MFVSPNDIVPEGPEATAGVRIPRLLQRRRFKARFKPTTVNGQAAKVSGTMICNFVLDKG